MKISKLILALALCVICVCGCDAENMQTTSTPENVSSEAEKPSDEKTEVKLIAASELPDFTDWTEIDRYTGDVDGDGADENVVLMTSSERDENGEMSWNDGQNWSLYVEDREQTFVLFNKFIQSTDVFFEVLDYYKDEGTKSQINTIVSSSASFIVNSYTFDSEKNAYIEECIYNTFDDAKDGTNRRFSSFPVIK